MQLARIHGPNDVRLDNVPAPKPGPRDVVIRVASVGICGSDVGYVAMGGVGFPTKEPLPIGHELSGTVVEIGAEAGKLFKFGDRVIVNPLLNVIGNGGPEGGFAEQLLIRDVVSQPASLLRMPAGMSFDVGALAEPLAVAMHAVNRAAPKAADKVAIFGAGPIGLAALAYMRTLGVEDVVSFDLSPLRRDRATKLGAKEAIDPRQEPAREALLRTHGNAPHFGMPQAATSIFIEATGAPGVIEEIIDLAPSNARIIVVSVHKKPAQVNFLTVLSKELTIAASMAYPSEFPDAIKLLEGGLDLEPMVTHRFAGPDFLEAFATAQQPDNAAKVIVQYDR